MRKKFLLQITLLLIVVAKLSAQQVIPLYQDSIPNSIGTLKESELPIITAYLPSKGKATGTAVIIFPGGAYSGLATSVEGTNVAKSFADSGITAFVVKYRLPNDKTMRDKSIGPFMDGQQAIKLVRMRAREWGIDEDKIGIIGYSAGGHLASTLGTHILTSYIDNKENINLRPDFMILVYPVISMSTELTHYGSRLNLLGKNPSDDQVEFFSSEKRASLLTPPTYITAAGDDKTVKVDNSIVFYQALIKEGIPVEMHLYPKGDHGFTYRQPVNEWLDPMLRWMRKGGWLK